MQVNVWSRPTNHWTHRLLKGIRADILVVELMYGSNPHSFRWQPFLLLFHLILVLLLYFDIVEDLSWDMMALILIAEE
jgi:hypothetical protein